MVKGFLLFLACFLAVNKVGKIELGALPLEAHGVNHSGERVGGNAVNPRASVIDGDPVIADIADVRAASNPIVRFQDQDRVAQVLQLPCRTESSNPRSNDDYVVSRGRVIPAGRRAIYGRSSGFLARQSAGRSDVWACGKAKQENSHQEDQQLCKEQIPRPASSAACSSAEFLTFKRAFLH